MTPMSNLTDQKTYDTDGHRLTNCCGAFSTFMDGEVLCCKACYQEVSLGEGDGSDDVVMQAPSSHIRNLNPAERLAQGREMCKKYKYTVESLESRLAMPLTRDERFFFQLCIESLKA
jgi:hypothetical protein